LRLCIVRHLFSDSLEVPDGQIRRPSDIAAFNYQAPAGTRPS